MNDNHLDCHSYLPVPSIRAVVGVLPGGEGGHRHGEEEGKHGGAGLTVLCTAYYCVLYIGDRVVEFMHYRACISPCTAYSWVTRYTLHYVSRIQGFG